MSIRALAFDTGGTVLDWHAGISRAFASAGAKRGLQADWPAITNDYRRRSLQGIVGQVNPKFNFDDVHRRMLDAVIAGVECERADAHRSLAVFVKYENSIGI